MGAVDISQKGNGFVSDPARNAFVIIPSDAEELSILPKGILVGGAGNIVLRAVDSAYDVTITVAAGQFLPIRANYVRATGTTSTGLLGLA